MNKLLVFVAFMLGTVNAGRIPQRDSQREVGTAVLRIEQMSWQDLVRQKFLLDIVHRVQQPLEQHDLKQLDQGLITDEDRYRFGIDEQIQSIIDLDRQRRLLNQQQIYSMRNADHVLQLRGIFRILAFSIDFETLQRNAIYLRRNINPVLFVHGLTLAIRSHPDTQGLIMPGMQEILPELYLDREMMQRIQRVQLDLEHSTRPTLMSLVGLGQSLRGVHPLMNMLMPWRELHRRLALRGQQLRENPNRLVVPMQTENRGMSLLTEDIGMRIFVQNLVSNLAVIEDSRMGNKNVMDLDMEQRRQQQENVEDERFLDALLRNEMNNEESPSRPQFSGRRLTLERNVGQGVQRMTSRISDGDDQLPSVDTNDERLLHVGQRRQHLNAKGREQEQLDTGLRGLSRGKHLSEGRRVDQEQIRQGSQHLWSMENLDDSLPTMRRDDERLVHINRRRLDQTAENMMPRRTNPNDEDTMTEEDIMQLIRSRLNQLNEIMTRKRKEQTEQERFMCMVRGDDQSEQEQELDDDFRLMSLPEVAAPSQRRNNRPEQRRRYRRSLDTWDNEQVTRHSEVLAHTLRQLVARLNQERISLRLGNEEMDLIDSSRLILPSENQARRNRVLLDQINRMASILGQLINRSIRVADSALGQLDETLRLDRMMGEILTGRLGDTGVLRILRELFQDSTDRQMDALGLDVSLNNRVLQCTLRRILDVVDEQREQQLGAYRREQLDLPGVTINEVRVSRLSTRIEEGDMDVSSLLEQPQQMQMLVRQRRLDNLPFTIDLNINSERAQEQDVVIRLLLGPRQDAEGRNLSLEQRRKSFVLLDAIRAKLQSGRNRVQHRSTNIGWTTRDVTPYSEIYRRVMNTMRGQQEQLTVEDLVGDNGRFPQRLLLPHGRPEGLPMQLLVIVSPLERQEHRVPLERTGGLMGISQGAIEDKRPLGFPLDRRIDNEQDLLANSNVQLQNVVIFHEN
ncbi:hypothetical protein ACLKA7_014728 [Drosophila subpalustris]